MRIKLSKVLQDQEKWWEQGTTENPLNNRARLVGTPKESYGMFVASHHSIIPNHVQIHELRAITRGGGKRALEFLTQEADKRGVELSVYPSPMSPGMGQQGIEMPKSKLRMWYAKFGFKPHQNDTMIRSPNKEVKEINKSYVNSIKEKLHDPTIELTESLVMPPNDPGIYVFRNVLNVEDWRKWAIENGVELDSKGGGLHVTVFGSTKLIPWTVDSNELILSSKRYQGFDSLGKDKATVLLLRAPELKQRWAQAKENGALFVHKECIPHLTLCYGGHTALTVPEFSLILGPETMRAYKKDLQVTKI